MIKIREFISKYSEVLAQNDIHNPQNEVEILISFFLKIERGDLFLNIDNTINDTDYTILKRAISERLTRKPLQYIIGNVPFLNTTINVNENVLIPRSETEFMVEKVIKEFGHVEPELTILDLCTGSGAIAISLKKNIQSATVYGSDISELALETAKESALLNKVEVNFIHADLFQIVDSQFSNHFVHSSAINRSDELSCNPQSAFRIGFDLIISNPPYVAEDIYSSLQPELLHEPMIAVVAGNSGLYFYEKIISQSRDFLNPNGVIYLEIGENQAKEILALAKKYEFLKIDLYKDLCEKDRIVRLQK